MLGKIMEKYASSSEARYGVSADWLRDIYGASRTAFGKFFLFSFMAGHRTTAPIDAIAIASIVSVIGQDCGPCLQIVVKGAQHSGVADDIITAVISGKDELLNHDLALVVRYSRAVSNLQQIESADLAVEIEALWGKSGLVDLAFAIASTQVFPTLKRALGHARTCVPVEIGGEMVAVNARQDMGHAA